MLIAPITIATIKLRSAVHLLSFQCYTRHISFISTGEKTPRMSRIFAFPLTAMLVGMSACGMSATDTPTESLATVPSEPIATLGEVSTLLTPASSPEIPSTQAYVDNPNSTLESNADSTPASTKANVVEEPSIGTDVGKTLPQFEINLFDGTKKSIARISSPGRPVFLFFFTTW